MIDTSPRLLGPGDPPPVRVVNPDGRSPHLIVCDHAGRAVPRGLDLGVTASEMDRHIAWDIGAEAVALLLGQALDATVILQAFSRLVVDCNRAPGHPSSICEISDRTAVPGNKGLASAAITARVTEIFEPYHAAIAETLDAWSGPACVVAMHSFTPVMGGVPRPWPVGVLYERNPAFARAVAEQLRAHGLLVGDNEPYQMSGEGDYTVPRHAWTRRLPYVELEVRQDLIAAPEGQQRWAALLADALTAAWAGMR